MVGYGGLTWSEYYGQERKGSKADVKNLRERVDAIPSIVQQAVNQAVSAAETKFQERVSQVQTQVQSQVNEKLNTILPVYMEKYIKWEKGGRRGPPPVANVDSAQSENVARPEALLTPPAPELNLPARTAVASGSHSAATCAPNKPVVGGASTLAEFDALKVTN